MKNIIFDLGGVLLNIDYELTVEAFKALGVKHFDRIFTQFNQDATAREFEMGKISDEDFRNYIRERAETALTDEQIDTAWNAMLLDFPLQRIGMLVDLKKDYKLFLLSNTNSIHYKEYERRINDLIHPYQFDALFDKTYYSHLIGLRKPDAEIYELVINENNLAKEETIFIDDSPVNVEAANDAGINTYDFEQGDEISSIINDILS